MQTLLSLCTSFDRRGWVAGFSFFPAPAGICRREAVQDVPPQVVGRATSAAVVNPISGLPSCVCAAITVNNTRIGDPGRNRTCDLQLRRLLLYPLSYGAVKGSDDLAFFRLTI